MEFFVYDVPKVLMLLTLVVFGVGVIRSFFTPERTRRILAGKRESLGNVLAALLGIVTPFCSCSAVPLFIGFLTTGVPLGVTFSFLISAPMVNEIAVVLLYGLFGWKIAAIYLGTGLLIAMVAGWTIGRLRMERQLEEWVYDIQGSISGEAHEFTTMYPGFLKEAEAEKKTDMALVFTYAMKAEEVHAGLYKEALNALNNKMDMSNRTVWLCPVCGNIFLGQTPEKCPICQAVRKVFREVS